MKEVLLVWDEDNQVSERKKGRDGQEGGGRAQLSLRKHPEADSSRFLHPDFS